MRITRQDEIVQVSEIPALDLAHAEAFQREVAAALPMAVSGIDLDLSETDCLDCAGIGALVALRRLARQRHAAAEVRLCNPSPALQRLLKLTKMDGLFPDSGHKSGAGRTASASARVDSPCVATTSLSIGVTVGSSIGRDSVTGALPDPEVIPSVLPLLPGLPAAQPPERPEDLGLGKAM
jgi:anti-anti-sigma factor